MTKNYITPNPEFFQWIYNRLVYQHHENPNMDYMLSLKERIKDMQEIVNTKTGNVLVKQKPTEQSEEDEKIFNTVIEKGDLKLSEIDWLKSLKERIKEE